MLVTFPQDDLQFRWTRHIKNKMLFYGLSQQRVRSVVRNPARTEEGIAPDTLAAMQPKKSGKKPEEVWVMYQRAPKSKKLLSSRIGQTLMISAWRYPGITKPGQAIPVPQDILDDLASGGLAD